MAVRGKPFQPGNKFGRGRPRGSRNKIAMAAQELINSHSLPVVRKALILALEDGKPAGQIAVLLAILDRIVPVRKEAPVNIGSLPTGTISEVSKSSEALVKKATSGKLTITEAQGIADLLEGLRKVIETEDLARRVAALEPRNEPT
jgi:hypothetical protein